MGQKKGQTGNPNGRPKGSPNKVTTEARTWLANLIDKNRAQIERDLKKLEPKDRLILLERLMAYTIPKASQMNVTFDQLSEQQLDQVVDNIINNLKE